jgi:hypothetical protein
MSQQQERKRLQLNLRMDGHWELLEAVKEAAQAQDISVNQFVINALRASVGWGTANRADLPSSDALESLRRELEGTLAQRLAEMVDRKLDERLGEPVAH